MRRVLPVVILTFILASCAATGVATKPTAGNETRESVLKERIAGNWQAMIDRDRGKMYDYYDPFFRSRVGRDWWIGQEMPIFYHSFEIVGVSLKGNVAYVESKVVYSIRHLGLTGREIKKDKTETVIKETWLFVDNNWYRQFYDNLTDGTFAHY